MFKKFILKLYTLEPLLCQDVINLLDQVHLVNDLIRILDFLMSNKLFYNSKIPIS